MAKSPQLEFLKKGTQNYGGALLNTRKGRTGPRPISVQHSMHFVLRSSRAKGAWSFQRHGRKIDQVLRKFAVKHGVRLKTMANVGNHLHLHLQLTNRHAYKPFIRAVTSAIMMAVTGCSRWKKVAIKKFWDGRPYSRIVVGFKAMLTMRDYIVINQLEAQGMVRDEARFFLRWQENPRYDPGR